MARKKNVDVVQIEDDISVHDIIEIRMFMADRFKKQLTDIQEVDPKSPECEKLNKKISELEDIDNALDAYNDIKGNIEKLPKIKQRKLRRK